MVAKCVCLDSTLYYGDYCQLRTNSLQVKQALSRSFASIAITAIVLTCSFVVLMDVLKYGFHIDPVKTERQKVRQEKAQSNGQKLAVRFQYVP